MLHRDRRALNNGQLYSSFNWEKTRPVKATWTLGTFPKRGLWCNKKLGRSVNHSLESSTLTNLTSPRGPTWSLTGKKTLQSSSTIPHLRATLTAVNTLSPVTITDRIWAAASSLIAIGDSSLSLFSNTIKPRKCNSISIWARGILINSSTSSGTRR